VALDIHQRERESISILDLKGRLVMGPEVTRFRDVVLPMVSANGARVLLNMAELAYIDSTGLGALVYCAATARKSSSAIKLLAMNARNLELLVTTKLETIFENYPLEQDAINSFFPDRAIQKFDILEFVREQQAHEE
jgi:anti-sigma B factor antagonist